MTEALPPDFGPALHRSSPVPLWAQVEESIGQAIVDGRLTPGQRLEPEALLCRRFSVSRPTLRQALTSLRRRGLITSRPGSGTFIAAAPQQPTDPLSPPHPLRPQKGPTVPSIRLTITQEPRA